LIVFFLFDEVRQEVGIAPACAAERLIPSVVIRGLTSDIDHGVDGAATSEHFGLRHDRRAPVELRLRKDAMERQVSIAGQIFHVSRRHGEDRAGSARPGLYEQNPSAMLRDETAGNNASGASAAHDDVIKRRHRAPW
jgi:hypothetical protein